MGVSSLGGGRLSSLKLKSAHTPRKIKTNRELAGARPGPIPDTGLSRLLSTIHAWAGPALQAQVPPLLHAQPPPLPYTTGMLPAKNGLE